MQIYIDINILFYYVYVNLFWVWTEYENKYFLHMILTFSIHYPYSYDFAVIQRLNFTVDNSNHSSEVLSLSTMFF